MHLIQIISALTTDKKMLNHKQIFINYLNQTSPDQGVETNNEICMETLQTQEQGLIWLIWNRQHTLIMFNVDLVKPKRGLAPYLSGVRTKKKS